MFKRIRYLTVIDIGILLLVVFAWFFFLFYPKLQHFITPDFGLSDQINFNYSLKHILAQSLSMNRIPWWNSLVNNGFPLVAEGQIGAFYLPNLILFKLLPFDYAFNLGYVLSFSVAALGSYLFFMDLKKRRFASIISAIIFTFSSTYILQITHYNLLQAYTLIPMIMFCIRRAVRRRNIGWLSVALLLLSQQFLTGYVMASFMTILISICYAAVLYQRNNKSERRWIIFFITCVICSLLLILSVSIQIIPTMEFTLNSTRISGLGSGSLSFSFPPYALLTYLNFNLFGNPSNGSYSYNLLRGLGSNFWESNVYFGLIPFLISVIGGFLLFKKNEEVRSSLIIVITSLLLSLGIYAPTYILFTLPLFNFFRSPSRFTIFLNLFLISIFFLTISSFLDSLNKKPFFRALFFVILICIVLFSVNAVRNYHVQVPKDDIYRNDTAFFLNTHEDKQFENSEFKIFSIGNEYNWSRMIADEGWKDPKKILFLQNDLIPYLNTVFHIPSAGIFPGSYFYPRKDYQFYSLIYNEYWNIDNNSSASPSALLINLLKLKNVAYLVTPKNFTSSDGFKKIHTINIHLSHDYSINIYQISNTSPRFYFADTYERILDINDAVSFLKTSIDSDRIVLGTERLGSDLFLKPADSTDSIKVILNNDTETLLNVNNSKRRLLVNSDSFYPGWNVYIDNTKKTILEVNINQKAVIMEPGKHIVKFIYEPWWKIPAMFGSILGYSVILSIILVYYSTRKKS